MEARISEILGRYAQIRRGPIVQAVAKAKHNPSSLHGPLEAVRQQQSEDVPLLVQRKHVGVVLGKQK